jgi:hypothetical protein
MKDPATAEIWQTAFGKECGGMAQGDNKTGQKGTNAMFVMNHDDITKILKAGKKFTYANPVVNHQPQKEDPNRIRIVAGGNLIDSTGKLSVPTANINTAKTPLEQCGKHSVGKIHVHRHQEFLPFRRIGILRIYEDPVRPVPTMDH